MRMKWFLLLVVVMMVIPGLVSAQTEWVDDPTDPVIGPPDPGAWDSADRNPLAVINVDSTYHLFFNGGTGGSPLFLGYDIGHATSSDGVIWEMDPANPVLTRGAEEEWDDETLWGLAVIHDESGFRMWYSGGDGDVMRAGYATSPDGTTWAKHPGNPVIDVGPSGSFDDDGVNPEAVIFQGGRYRMWYMSAKKVGFPVEYDWRIGYAESTDGLSWTKHPTPVLEPGDGWESWLVYGPTVLFDGMNYHLWFTGHDRSHIAIGYAASPDGLVWTRYAMNPVVDRPGAAGVDGPNVLFDTDNGSFEMWYRDIDTETIHRASSACCSTVYSSIIPAAAYAAGAEGSFYETDVDLSNAATADVEYRFSWLPRGEDNSDPISSELFTLGAGMSVRYANVLAEVFDLEPDAFGALVIEASNLDLLAMARIANIAQDGSGGTFGQAVPAVPLDEFHGLRERRRLLFGTENAEMRFNVGCQNGSGTATRVNFELVGADGTLLGTESLILMPWSNDQLNRIFDQFHPITGCVDFWADIASTQIYCYGSVLDNVTSDPATIPPM